MRIAIFILTLAYAPWCQAGLIYVAQSRSITLENHVDVANTNNSSVPTKSAPDFLPFSSQLSGTATFNGVVYGASMADTDSTLGGMEMTATGHAAASSIGGLGPDGGIVAAAEAISQYVVTFTVENTGQYLLSGTLHSYANSNPADGPDAFVGLSGDRIQFVTEESTIHPYDANHDDDTPFSVVIQLLVGQQYQLSAQALAEHAVVWSRDGLVSAPVELSADYTFTLAPVPEPSSVCLVASALALLAVPLRRLQQAGWRRAQH